MQIEVGYSEHPESDVAGTNAAKRAILKANRSDPCDLVLVFATALHNMSHLRGGIASAVGEKVPIIGGGAVGAISNDRFGYAGEQVILAAVWLEGVGFEMFSKGEIAGREHHVGKSIGKKMAEAGLGEKTACILLYDAVDRSRGDVRLNLATPLMEGIEEGLGFLPSTLIGAGLQGDYQNSTTMQLTGSKLVEQYAMMLAFKGDVAIDSTIMHGCRPYGEIYTVTKADKQTILEVNGQPALPFIQSQLRPQLPVEEFPFFMIFGVNKDPGNPYNEVNYANRLCLAIDPPRNGIVMFESDMVEGTKFQIMYRSLDLKYIPPKIELLFQKAREQRRKPVLAIYIDCAGRAAAYGGGDLEDAEIVQNAVDSRVPLLGIYSGVEIAPILNKPRTLDWTGVFSLITTPGKA